MPEDSQVFTANAYGADAFESSGGCGWPRPAVKESTSEFNDCMCRSEFSYCLCSFLYTTCSFCFNFLEFELSTAFFKYSLKRSQETTHIA